MKIMHKIGVLTTTLVVLLGILLIVGLWQGWFALDVGAHDRDEETTEYRLSLIVNPQKIESDAREVRKDIGQLGQQADVATDLRTVRGRLSDIDPDGDQIVVTSDEDPPATVSLRIESVTEFQVRDADAAFTDLDEGDRVVVTYREKDDPSVRVAMKVKVLTPGED